MHQLHHAIAAYRHQRHLEATEDVVCMDKKLYEYMQSASCEPIRQEFLENEC